MASSTEICNMALVALGQEPVITLDDSTPSSRLCKRLYKHTVEALLRAYPWTFAIKRVVMAQESEPPAFGYMYKYKLPTECLRIVELNIPFDSYRLEGNSILTDEPMVTLRYVSSVDDENLMDAQFISVLVLRLAILMCIKLTADQDLYTKLMQQENQQLILAQNTQAIEASPQPVIEGPWIPSRF